MSNFTVPKGNVAPSEKTLQFRRIVTGHAPDGKAIFIEDQICPNRFTIGGNSEFVTNELWKMEKTPDSNEGDGSDPARVFALNPPRSGNVFRILELPPDKSLGVMENGEPAPPTMHRTASLDYAYVIKGEIYAVLDKEEKLMKEGDVLVQRGTNHAWSNRSSEPCIILFVLCGAKELPGLAPQ